MNGAVLRAPALRPGDRVAVVTPSSPVVSRERLDEGLDVLRGWGFEPHRTPHALEVRGHLAGTDEQRSADLNDAFRDPSIRAVWASRGGFGVTRILDRLDWEALSADPKLLVGFSDVSALLLAAWRHARLVTVHGQFVGRLGLQPPRALDLLRRLVTTHEPLGAALPPGGGPLTRVVAPGTAEGRLVGGNLALLTALIGTSDLPDLRDAILFVEDVGEAPYRLDRMLIQARASGALDGVAGVVVGELVDCEASSSRPSLSAAEVVDEILGGLGVPVIADVPIGHVDRQLPLPVGARARIDAGAGTLELLEAAVR